MSDGAVVTLAMWICDAVVLGGMLGAELWERVGCPWRDRQRAKRDFPKARVLK